MISRLSLSSFACFLSKLPLILMVGRKRKKRAGDICKRTLNIEFEQDSSVGLGATLRERQKIKNYFFSFKDFPGIADSVILLRFEVLSAHKML